jgi:cation transport ATPase
MRGLNVCFVLRHKGKKRKIQSNKEEENQKEQSKKKTEQKQSEKKRKKKKKKKKKKRKKGRGRRRRRRRGRGRETERDTEKEERERDLNFFLTCFLFLPTLSFPSLLVGVYPSGGCNWPLAIAESFALFARYDTQFILLVSSYLLQLCFAPLFQI